jgi:TP901 family phage tail tape measure protein
VAGNLTAGNVIVRLSADTTPLTQGLANAANRLNSFGTQATKLGQNLSLKVTAPLALMGRQMVKTASEFEASLGKISGLVGVASNEVAKMGDAARGMSTRFGKSAGEAANALFYITSAGLRGSAAMSVLEQSLKASAIGLGDTATVADLATSAVNAYGIDALSASAATDTMVATIREGKLETSELAGSMGRVLPLASAMGVSFQEVGAAFAALSRTGTNASEAATQIRGILASLLRPTKQAEEAMSGLGLSAQGLRDQIKTQGLLSTLETLAEKFDGNEAASAAVFGNIRALSGVLDLMGANVETTRQIFANMENNLGDTDKALESFSDTAQFKMAVASAKMKDAMLAMGQVLITAVVPIMTTLSSAIQKVASFISNLPGPIKTVIAVFGVVAVAMGPVLIALGAMAKAFAAVSAAAAIAGGAQAASGVGAFTLGLSKMIPLLTHPAFLGAAATFGVIGFAIGKLRGQAKEAQEKQDRLTQAFKDAAEPAYVLSENVSGLADRYDRIAESAPEVTNKITSTEGAFAASEIAMRGMSDAAKIIGIDYNELGEAARRGSQETKNFYDRIGSGSISFYYFADVLQDGVDGLVPFADGMLEAYEAGKLTQDQIVAVAKELSAIITAYDDAREANEANNKTSLLGGEAYKDLARILGADVVNGLIATNIALANAANSATPYTDALALIYEEAEAVVVGLEEAAEAAQKEGSAANDAIRGTMSLAEAIRQLRAESEGGAVTVDGLATKLGFLGDLLANELALYLMDVNNSADEMFNGLADGESTLLDVERAAREMSGQIAEIVADTANLGGETADAIPSIVRLIDSLYDGAKAAGVSRDQVIELIRQIGVLDGLSPTISLALTLDATAIRRQLQRLSDMFETRGGGEALLSQIRELEALLRSIETIDIEPPGRGGGGGGGGGRADDPFAWVEDWVKDLADFTASLMSEDFADRLIEMSADDIAKAIRKLLVQATELGVSLLPGGPAALDDVRKFGDQLIGVAGDLAIQNEKLREAQQEVTKLQNALDGLTDQYKEFRRVELGIGEATTVQRLDEQLSKLSELKTTLASLKDEYEAFKTGGVTALSEQLDKLEELKSVLTGLESDFASLNAAVAGPTGLEKELMLLDDLAGSYENLKQARQSYAEQTASSLGNITFGARGGALFSAKRYLQKAQAFRDIVSSLRDRAFPPSIIRDVIAAGLDGGTALGKKLLALGDDDLAEFKRVQEQIQSIAAQTGEIAADVLFTADVNDAEAAFNRQLALVQQMYQRAIAQAQNEFAAQQAIVEGVYQDQIAQAEMVLEHQKKVVEALFQQALAEATANLEKAQATADALKTSIGDLKDAMRDLITAIANAINAATQTQQPGQTGGGPSGGPNYLPGGMPGQVTAPPSGLTGGSPTASNGWTGLGFDQRGGGYLQSPTGDVFYLEPGIDFGALGRRAKGGPVLAGQSYVVGELGPEIFAPRSSGTIIPNDMVGVGGGTKNYTINVNVAGGQNIGREVVRAIEEYERRNGAGWRS